MGEHCREYWRSPASGDIRQIRQDTNPFRHQCVLPAGHKPPCECWCGATGQDTTDAN